MCRRSNKHEESRAKVLQLIASYYKTRYPEGFYTVQIGGTTAGEMVVDDFSSEEKGRSCFGKFQEYLESHGYEIKDHTDLAIALDPKQPQEILKIDIWKGSYLHTIKLLYWGTEIDAEQLLLLMTYKKKLSGSALNLPTDPKWWEC